MPELAEVEYMRKRWDPGIGFAVRAVRMHHNAKVFRGQNSRQLSTWLRGSKLQFSEARGKQMIFHFEPGGWLGIHLGMTGQLDTAGPTHRPARHEHLVLQMDDLSLIFRDTRLFGRIRFETGELPPLWWSSLPPDLHGPDFKRQDLDRFLDRRAGSTIKAVLMMQERFPGIGNWMADEILWRCRIRPARKGGALEVDERRRLYREIRTVVRASLKTIARPGDHWGDPPSNWLFHQRWADGGRCPKTGAPLVREKIGGRTTCWSPSWQS
jgi:formamidopyrimidine-DNA glycosylase